MSVDIILQVLFRKPCFLGCGFPDVAGRHYLAAGILVLWLLIIFAIPGPDLQDQACVSSYEAGLKSNQNADGNSHLPVPLSHPWGMSCHASHYWVRRVHGWVRLLMTSLPLAMQFSSIFLVVLLVLCSLGSPVHPGQLLYQRTACAGCF